MTDTGAPNLVCKDYGRLKVSGVELLLLLRVLEDSLRLTDTRQFIFAYTNEFRRKLYDDIIRQQDQEIK